MLFYSSSKEKKWVKGKICLRIFLLQRCDKTPWACSDLGALPALERPSFPLAYSSRDSPNTTTRHIKYMVRNSVGVRKNRRGELRNLLYPAFRAAGCSAFLSEKKNTHFLLCSVTIQILKNPIKRNCYLLFCLTKTPRAKWQRERREKGQQHGETDRQVTLSKLITVGQWALHSQIQPTVNGKYSKNIIPEISKKQNLNLPYNDTRLHSIHTVLG